MGDVSLSFLYAGFASLSQRTKFSRPLEAKLVHVDIAPCALELSLPSNAELFVRLRQRRASSAFH